MLTERRLRLLMLALLAPAGVCAGHCLAYLFALPDPQRRAQILETTGHPWWGGQVVPASLAIALGIVFALLVAALQKDADRRDLRRQVCAWLASRLVVVQLVAFLVLEAVERLIAGIAVGDLLTAGLLQHGILAQVGVALLLTGTVWLLALAAAHLPIGPVSWRVPDLGAPVLLAAVGRVPVRHDLVSPRQARAPPALS